MNAITLVVPCYNEAARLDGAALVGLVDAHAALRLLLVDDGSTDRTAERLRTLAAERPTRIELLALPANGGKAEAVRQGLQHALAGGVDVVGYFDADLSTPPPEILRLVQTIDASGVAVVMGARVALLGRDIRRRAARHYLGRIFATTASIMLGVRVYDTQCGAKLFRRTPALVAALERPFRSRWAFDVELLGRLLSAGLPIETFVEVPLMTWRDVPGSKLNVTRMGRAYCDLLLIGMAHRRREKKGGPGGPPSDRT